MVVSTRGGMLSFWGTSGLPQVFVGPRWATTGGALLAMLLGCANFAGSQSFPKCANREPTPTAHCTPTLPKTLKNFQTPLKNFGNKSLISLYLPLLLVPISNFEIFFINT